MKHKNSSLILFLDERERGWDIPEGKVKARTGYLLFFRDLMQPLFLKSRVHNDKASMRKIDC